MISNTTRHRRLEGQGGSILLTFAVSIVGLFCFAVVAIDGAILMTTRNQLQCAADAAALAGASGLRSGGENEARARAETFAEFNFAVQDSIQPVLIDPDDDVEVNVDEGWVRVTTHRTEATGDALRTYFLRILDLAAGLNPTRANRVDVTAVATAEVVDLCGARCLKPWAIPDRWDDEDGDGHYDHHDSLTVDVDGDGQLDPGDQYKDLNKDGNWDDSDEFYDPIATGYLAPGDVGAQITLKSDENPGPIAPGQYFPISLPPINRGDPLTGADIYWQWIVECAPFLVAPGDICLLEPGAKVGPTIMGVQELINQDPDAYWDTNTNSVQGSIKGTSPRIALVPFFDPQVLPESGRNQVQISKIGAFFIESVGPGSQVNGRFIQVAAQGEPCDENSGTSFIVGIHLIE